MKDGRMEAAFDVGQVRYSHWDFDHSRGWPSDFWLAAGSVEAENYKEAFMTFRRELNSVVPKIALIGQTYTDYLQQPFLIAKDGAGVGFFRYTRRKARVGLMLVEDHLRALGRLVGDASIPEEFYYYWNDVVNAVGYTPKLLLMCAAIECLTRTGHRDRDWDKVRRILGSELTEDLYGTIGDSSRGLRNRLAHGEYFGASHSGKDYVELIHRKIMAYFNDHILQEQLLSLDIVSPQRHIVGTLEGGSWFIKSRTGDDLTLKNVVADFEEHDVNGLERHEIVYDASLPRSY
jgi:hypothetical protein